MELGSVIKAFICDSPGPLLYKTSPFGSSVHRGTGSPHRRKLFCYLTSIPACWIYGIFSLKQVVQRKTVRNFYNIDSFAGGSSSQEVQNDRTGEQDVRTVQG